MSTCPACGAAVDEADLHCPTCGGELRGDHTDDTPDHHERGLLEFALTYPVSNGWMPLIIGAVLSLLGIFLLPVVILYGFAYRVGRAGAQGADRIPAYGDWFGLLRDGLLLFVAYLPIIVLGVMLGGLIALSAVMVDTVGLAALAMLLLALPVFLVLAYFGGAILPTFIATGSVVETYRNARFLRFALTMPYLKGFVVFIVLNVIVGIAASILAFVLLITIVGILLIFPLYLVVNAYVAYLLGSLWGYIVWEVDGEGPIPAVTAGTALGARF